MKRKLAEKPAVKPACPNFSSGPCAKRPGYKLDEALGDAMLGRSHRSAPAKAKLLKACVDTGRILGIPKDYKIGIVPASDTGAVEMAMWSMLGPRAVDVCCWESFGKEWMNDVINQLPLQKEHGGKGVRCFDSDYGCLPDLSATDCCSDIVFPYNGTTSGVRVPNLDWIKDNRLGLTICDATSAVFAMDMQWSKLDVLTFSWQKVLGGEAGHGMMVLSPRAVARLESYSPKWPLPKIFRMTKKGQLMSAVFHDSPINSVSMMCVEDYLDALGWVDRVGGLDCLIQKSEGNLSVFKEAVNTIPWLEFLAKDPETISCTSVCMVINDMDTAQLKQMLSLLTNEAVAYDIGAYKTAPPGIRVWCGATVERSDLEALVPWLVWAHDEIKGQ